MGLKDVLIKDGPRLAMMAMAGATGGPMALEAVLRGGARRDALAQQTQHQQQADVRAEEMHRAQLDNLQADNDRQMDAQQMDKLRQALALISGEIEGQSATATDPVQAENVVMQRAQSAASVFGLAPDRLTAAVPNMTPKVAAGQKRRAKEKYAEFIKTYGDQAADFANTAKVESGEFAGKTFAELGQLAEAVAPIKPSTNPGVQTTERLALAAFAKERGKAPDQLSSDDLLAFNKSFRQSDDRIPSPADALKPMQEFSITERLAKAWGDANKSTREMTRQLTLMESGLKQFRGGNRNAGSQAVLVTFQKILDPTSVVRESEYARTAAGQSLLSRIDGAMERLASGGAGLTDQELDGMVQTARTFLTEMQTFNQGQRKRIEAQVTKYKLDPATVFDDVLLGGDTTPAPQAGGSKKYEIISVTK